MSRKSPAVVLVVCLLLNGLANGQSTDAVVSGAVTDPSGAAVPRAAVTAQNTKTGVSSTVKTNQAGVYLFAALQPGAYRIIAEREGFQKYNYEHLELEVGAQLNIN